MTGSLPYKYTRAVCEGMARRSLAAGAPPNTRPTAAEVDAWILGLKRGRQIQRERQMAARPKPCQHEWHVERPRGDERLCGLCGLWEQARPDGSWVSAHDTTRLRIAP